MCDGEEDCFSGDDEKDCPTTTVATDGGTDTPFVIGSGISGSGSGSGSVSSEEVAILRQERTSRLKEHPTPVAYVKYLLSNSRIKRLYRST